MKQDHREKLQKKKSKEVFIPGLSQRPKKVTIFRDLDEESNKFNSVLIPNNVKEEKEKFFKYGLSPNFKYSKGYAPLFRVGRLERFQINTNLYFEAKAIIDEVCDRFGNGIGYVDEAFGKRISQDEATEFIQKYIKSHELDGCMKVFWSPNLIASGKMMWTGPHQKFNKPELRKYSFVIRNSQENIYLREDGIRCLVNHEIGTHYFRFFNDGQQVWYSDRQKFGLCSQSSRKMAATEEGLATVNTLLSAKSKYLWGAAMLYYIACKALDMSFKQLFDHLSQYIPDPELRWRHVLRVKRGIPDVTQNGGFGHDQVYFEGAVEILRSIDNIDFLILYSGRISTDEVTRVKRLARMDCMKMPLFVKDIAKYKRMLKHIAYINGLDLKPPKPVPSKLARTKSAPKFKLNPAIYQPQPKPKPDMNLPSLLNFKFKDHPVDYQPPRLTPDDFQEQGCYLFGYISTYDSLLDCDSLAAENSKSSSVSDSSRAFTRERLLHRPTAC